ncbi:hypothetical protein [Pseudonocardia sp. H11422]|uniref:hypothetical protein n=1 Tax=Pseudonocardia sp. H11422 TaxID=2835866 RepID=UPI001BDC70D3|nr:hypothetical protein [Pseudonocardia sp. H11422]
MSADAAGMARPVAATWAAPEQPAWDAAHVAVDVSAAHWSATLPPGTGRSAAAGVWLVPATVLLAIIAGLVLRGWLA